MILVVGEALVDAHLEGDVLRTHAGGGPLNTAVALGRLGVPVTFLGALSTDGLGRSLRAALDSSGALTTLAPVEAPTPLAIVEASTDGDVDYRFYIQGTAFDLLGDCLPASIPAAAAAFVGSLALALDPPGASVEEFAVRAAERCCLVLDPNVRPALIRDRQGFLRRFERLAALAGIVKLSRADAGWLYPGRPASDVALSLVSGGAACVVITDGAAGATAWTATTSADASAPRVDVVDTVGAGDAFTAGLLGVLWDAGNLSRRGLLALEKSELGSALSYAAATGAAQCERASAWGPTVDDVDRVLQTIATGATEPPVGGRDGRYRIR